AFRLGDRVDFANSSSDHSARVAAVFSAARTPRLAAHLLNFENTVPDHSLTHPHELNDYLANLAMPWKRQDGVLICAGSDDPQSRRWLRGRYGEYAWIVPEKRQVVSAAIEKRFRARLARDATFRLAHCEPR